MKVEVEVVVVGVVEELRVRRGRFGIDGAGDVDGDVERLKEEREEDEDERGLGACLVES